jgi:hypothetical protein
VLVSGFGFTLLQGPTLTTASLIAGVGGTSRRIDLFFGITRSIIIKSGYIKKISLALKRIFNFSEQ